MLLLLLLLGGKAKKPIVIPLFITELFNITLTLCVCGFVECKLYDISPNCGWNFVGVFTVLFSIALKFAIIIS